MEYWNLIRNTGIHKFYQYKFMILHKNPLFNNPNTFKHVNYNDILEKKLGATN